MGAWDLERKGEKTGENHDRTLEERIKSGQDWEQWLASVEDVKEEERLVAEAKETAKAWVNSLVWDIDIPPK